MPAGAAPCDNVLPALAGIATRVKCEELGRYIAGLWETQLPQGLFWFARGVSSCKETSISRAPGFSWASLAGTSKVNEATWMLTSLPEDDNTRQLFQVPDVQCDASSHNPFGLVTKASILLRGYLLPVKLKGEKGPPPCNAIILSGTLEQHVTAYMDRAVITGMGVKMDFTCFFGFTTKEENHLTYDKARRGTENKTTICLLLLECVGQDVYQRVGCVPEIENEGLWLKHAKEKEFMLI
ncbi:uncharacterized protein PAC_03654 [Phialocephala subalpina]|uniref:Heterokaryon incompatibility domain-containing protein n=1 Tax=Phialocephala subalpina TaxID=576137 RepID=A0A1L7WLX6_9HELO|nr:uncharacterized protein PAC_03654 [Phialocephala subalpina]